jgi:hypothetical protein
MNMHGNKEDISMVTAADSLHDSTSMIVVKNNAGGTKFVEK